MNKVTIVKSDSVKNKFRLILNANENFSVGVILDLVELKQLSYEINDMLESAVNQKTEQTTV